MLTPVERGGKDPKTRTGKIENKKIGKSMTMIRSASVNEWEGRLLHYSDGPQGLWMTVATREAVVSMVDNGLYKLTDKLYSEEAWELGGEAEVQIRNALMTGMREERRPTEGAAKGKERAEEKMAFANERRGGGATEREQRGAERAEPKGKKTLEFGKLEWGEAPEGSTAHVARVKRWRGPTRQGTAAWG